MLHDSEIETINIKRVTLPEVQPKLGRPIDGEQDITEDQWQLRVGTLKENCAEALLIADLKNDTRIDYQVVLARALADLACVSPARFKAAGIPAELLDQLFQTASQFERSMNSGRFYRFFESLVFIDPGRCREFFTTWASDNQLENYATKTSGQITFDRARFMVLLKQMSPTHPAVLKKDILIDEALETEIERWNKTSIQAVDMNNALNLLRRIAMYRLASSQDIKPDLDQRLIEKVRELLHTIPACHLELLKYAMIATADKVEFGAEGMKMSSIAVQKEHNTPLPVLKAA